MKQQIDWMWQCGVVLSSAAMLALTGCAGTGEDEAAARARDAQVFDDEMRGSEPETDFDRNFSLLEQAMSDRPDMVLDLDEPLALEDDFTFDDRPLEGQSSALANPQGSVSVEPETDTVAEADAADEPDGSDGLAIGVETSGADARPSAEQRAGELALQLGALLREMGEERASPVGAMLHMAMLEALEPGLLEAEYGPVESAAASMRLTDEERLLVDAALRAGGLLRDELAADFVDPERIAASIQTLADELRAVRRLELRDARLCLRVDNFGVYRAVQQHGGRYKFLAGRAHPVIVYTELEHFTRSPSTRDGVPGFVVNVQQALRIYRIGTEDAPDTESTLVWQLEPQPVLDFSRNLLRDFFIVQVIELPKTLSVGSYRLKVIATDVASGEEVEHGIEFDVVADSSALRDRGFDSPVAPDRYNPNR